MKLKTLKGCSIVPGGARGLALVSRKPISFLGGVDPESGMIEKDHDLEGKSVKERVLCFPHGHGSRVGSYVLYSLAKKGFGPKAIVNLSGISNVLLFHTIRVLPARKRRRLRRPC